MTREELEKNDGRDGKPAYVAVSGVIYDVTLSPLWCGGNHEGVHQAGQDLTEELKSAPHVRAVVERFPVVGQLKTTVPAAPSKKLPLVSILVMAAIALLIVILLLM